MKTLDAKTLALYLGQKCTYSLDIEWTIMGVYENDMCEVGIRGQSTTTDIANIKPILRKLSNITDAEAVEWFLFFYPDEMNFPTVNRMPPSFIQVYVQYEHGMRSVSIPVDGFKEYPPKIFLWLLSRGFDLFKLIDSGLALNQEQEEK